MARHGLRAVAIARDTGMRSFMLVGTLALALPTPFAATSFNRAIRALGAARWRLLHRLGYPIALLSLLHFFWMQAAKNNYAQVLAQAAIVALSLGWRLRAR